ncbi:hypothetical protein L798_14179 [Zootermopsis nevadensis]|uniref:Uncharacterized protein n=1 Tax=Zootermopsis nevadensis TaxID=136037 RepID=A0A067R000_ZOONE|nr:hypothetical protein L798_14179 [Zootermopsis nevadensis]
METTGHEHIDIGFMTCLITLTVLLGTRNYFFVGLIYGHLVGLLGRGIGPSQGLCLYTGQHNTEKGACFSAKIMVPWFHENAYRRIKKSQKMNYWCFPIFIVTNRDS